LTWQQKLQPPPRPRYSAREIANDLDLGVQAVLDALKSLEEFIDSPARKIIEEPVRKRLYAFLQFPYEPPAASHVTAWESRDRGGSAKTSTKQRGPQGAAEHRGPHRISIGPLDTSVGLGHPTNDASESMADASWKLHGFTQVESDAWRVFLRRGQAKLAAQLRDAGFIPEHLNVVVGGWPVAKRLRAGESPTEVMRLLGRQRQAS